MIDNKLLTYYEPTIAFFGGKCANPKVSAKKTFVRTRTSVP